MNQTISKVDEAILESNKIICRQISRLDQFTRGEISQEVLESLRHFVEHILLKEYSNGNDIEDTQDNIKLAVKCAKSNPDLRHLSQFHRFLQVSASHRVVKEQNAERLMIKYYEYLLRIRNFLHDKYSLDVLANLEQFPLEIDNSLGEYYEKIAQKINDCKAISADKKLDYDRFYIQKIKPFFINNKIYYEISFVPANDSASKTDRIIAFSDIEISDFYAVKFSIVADAIEIFGKHMPIRIIVDWQVSIRPCELKNFASILQPTSNNYGKAEQRELSRYLTESRFSLSEIIKFPDNDYQAVRNRIVPRTDGNHFFDILDTCRKFILAQKPGSNILLYLLYHLKNRIG